jgi:dihydrofolate reductase
MGRKTFDSIGKAADLYFVLPVAIQIQSTK